MQAISKKSLASIGSAVTLFLWGCSTEEPPLKDPLYEEEPQITTVAPAIAAAFGIADSKANPGYLWVQEDSGNPAQLYLLQHDGAVAKTFALRGAGNRDWEDIALSGSTLYVADIGDNAKEHPTYTIYKFPEPTASENAVHAVDRIVFSYPDGSQNAEAFLVEHETRDIYIITKGDSTSGIYKISYPYSTATVNAAALVGTLPYSAVVSAALSADGKEVIIKTYTSLFHYSRAEGELIEQALQQEHTSLPYKLEPQGEAVAFAADNSGYFTLSEQDPAEEAVLYFYQKL